MRIRTHPDAKKYPLEEALSRAFPGNGVRIVSGFASSVIYHPDGTWEEHEHEHRLTSDLRDDTVDGIYRIRLRRRGRWARPIAEAT